MNALLATKDFIYLNVNRQNFAFFLNFIRKDTFNKLSYLIQNEDLAL